MWTFLRCVAAIIVVSISHFIGYLAGIKNQPVETEQYRRGYEAGLKAGLSHISTDLDTEWGGDNERS